MFNPNGIIAKLTGNNSSGSLAAQNTGVPVVNDIQIASYGSIALGGNLSTQNVVEVPNYKNLDISSLTPSGVSVIPVPVLPIGLSVAPDFCTLP